MGIIGVFADILLIVCIGWLGYSFWSQGALSTWGTVQMTRQICANVISVTGQAENLAYLPEIRKQLSELTTAVNTLQTTVQDIKSKAGAHQDPTLTKALKNASDAIQKTAERVAGVVKDGLGVSPKLKDEKSESESVDEDE